MSLLSFDLHAPILPVHLDVGAVVANDVVAADIVARLLHAERQIVVVDKELSARIVSERGERLLRIVEAVALATASAFRSTRWCRAGPPRWHRPPAPKPPDRAHRSDRNSRSNAWPHSRSFPATPGYRNPISKCRSKNTAAPSSPGKRPASSRRIRAWRVAYRY